MLHQDLHARGDLAASLVQHEVHLALAHHLADRGLGGLQHVVAGIAVVEEPVFRALQRVLDRELHVDDVLVVGEHQRFRLLVARVSAVSHLDGAHLRDVHVLDALHRVRRVPAQSRHRGLEVLAEAQHHAARTFVDDVEAAEQPDGHDEQDDEHHAPADGAIGGAARGARRIRSTRTESKESRDLLLELPQDLIEIGRTFVVLLSPLGIVRGHREFFRKGATT